MLKITQHIIDLYKQEKEWEPLFTTNEATILRLGTEEDADAFFTAFLDRPGWQGEMLLEPVRVLGREKLARRIVQECFQGDQLREEMSDDILLCLGHMQASQAEALLWPYAAGKLGYHWHGRQACMGLLHLPCENLKQEIEAGVRACYGKNWWASEYLPILAYKTGKQDLLEGLYQLGSTTASTDCNGGLVLGIALYGETGRSFFQRLLWDPYWEADASATGTAYATALGCRYLQISPLDLYTNLQTLCSQTTPNTAQISHGFALISAMIKLFDTEQDDLLTIKFLPGVQCQIQDMLDHILLPENSTERGIINLARTFLTDEEEKEQIVSTFVSLREQLLQQL